MAGALLFGVADALQLQLAITPEFGGVPRELLIAAPYLVVIVALVVWGRGIRYPGRVHAPVPPGMTTRRSSIGDAMNDQE